MNGSDGGKLHAIYCSWHSNMKPGTQALTCVHLYAGTHTGTHTHTQITNTQQVSDWLLSLTSPCVKYWFLCNVHCFKRPTLVHAGYATQYFYFTHFANYQRLHRQEERYKWIKLPDSLSMIKSSHHEASLWLKHVSFAKYKNKMT